MSNNNIDEEMFSHISEINGSFLSGIYALFVILYRILLFNMFVAIISAHYFQYQREVLEDQKG